MYALSLKGEHPIVRRHLDAAQRQIVCFLSAAYRPLRVPEMLSPSQLRLDASFHVERQLLFDRDCLHPCASTAFVAPPGHGMEVRWEFVHSATTAEFATNSKGFHLISTSQQNMSSSEAGPSRPRRSQFRPCIDLHDGVVKQIVGGSLDLSSSGSAPTTNFVAQYAFPHLSTPFR